MKCGLGPDQCFRTDWSGWPLSSSTFTAQVSNESSICIYLLLFWPLLSSSEENAYSIFQCTLYLTVCRKVHGFLPKVIPALPLAFCLYCLMSCAWKWLIVINMESPRSSFISSSISEQLLMEAAVI